MDPGKSAERGEEITKEGNEALKREKTTGWRDYFLLENKTGVVKHGKKGFKFYTVTISIKRCVTWHLKVCKRCDYSMKKRDVAPTFLSLWAF